MEEEAGDAPLARAMSLGELMGEEVPEILAVKGSETGADAFHGHTAF